MWLTCQVTLPSSPYEDKENERPYQATRRAHSTSALRPLVRRRPTVLPPFDGSRQPVRSAARQGSVAHARALNPSAKGRRERALALAKELRPGLWCSGREPWPLDHSASHLRVGSATTEFALRVVLPAMCRLAASE